MGLPSHTFSPSRTSNDRLDFTKRLRRSHSERRRQQRRAGVYPDREHVAHCQRRGRSDTRQTIGHAQRSRRPRFSQQLYEYPSRRYSSLLRTMAKSRSRVYYRAKGQVRRDPLLHSRSRWLYYRSWAKQAGRRLRLKGATDQSIYGDRVHYDEVTYRRTDPINPRQWRRAYVYSKFGDVRSGR
jgi:hypothetical protein